MDKYGHLSMHEQLKIEKEIRQYVVDYASEILDVRAEAAAVLESFHYEQNHAYWGDYLCCVEEFIETMGEFLGKM